jgi:hypothetical protein
LAEVLTVSVQVAIRSGWNVRRDIIVRRVVTVAVQANQLRPRLYQPTDTERRGGVRDVVGAQGVDAKRIDGMHPDHLAVDDRIPVRAGREHVVRVGHIHHA